MDIKTIILAGGFGKRLAPLSTEEKPKQFHDLAGVGISLFQQTILRALKISLPKDIFTVANIAHKNIALSQASVANYEVAQNVIFENEPKNTAHAISIALEKIKTGIVVVMPSDHVIEGDLSGDIAEAIGLAAYGKIVTFGITPESPDSNYGYIYSSSFNEKPDPYIAEELISKGALWNSGIFVFDVEVVRAELAALYGDEIPSISFDKAILEKTNRLAVIHANFEWADLGNWESLRAQENYKEKEYA